MRPQSLSTSAVPYNTPTATSHNLLPDSQVGQAAAAQPTQLPQLNATSTAHPSAPPTATSRNMLTDSQVGQAVAAQPTQLPQLASTPSAPTGNADISLSAIATGAAPETSLRQRLAALQRFVLDKEAFCPPCWSQSHSFDHIIDVCPRSVTDYIQLGSPYRAWKSRWDIPRGNCFSCCLPTVCEFSSLPFHVSDGIF